MRRTSVRRAPEAAIEKVIINLKFARISSLVLSHLRFYAFKALFIILSTFSFLPNVTAPEIQTPSDAACSSIRFFALSTSSLSDA